MAHQVVWRPDQFVAREAADLDEGLVAVGDLSFGIGGGDQALLGREGALALGDGLVVSHACRFFGEGLVRVDRP
ncbi:hypothetical protein D3C78_1606740 [compost metagenome]